MSEVSHELISETVFNWLETKHFPLLTLGLDMNLALATWPAGNRSIFLLKMKKLWH